MTNREVLKAWCKENKLTLPNVCSVAFIPQGTLNHVLAGDSSTLAAKARLYDLTSLEAFKLNSTEDVQYQKESLNKKYDSYWDRKISEVFILNFKKDGLLPVLDYQLSPSKGENQNKKALISKIVKEFLTDNNQTENPTTLLSENQFDFTGACNDLDTICSLPDKEFLKVIKDKRATFRYMADKINTILDGDPLHARNKISNLNKTFQNATAKQ